MTQRSHRQFERILQRSALDVVLLEVRRHDIGRATHDGEPVFVGNLAVIGQSIELVILRIVADLATNSSTS